MRFYNRPLPAFSGFTGLPISTSLVKHASMVSKDKTNGPSRDKLHTMDERVSCAAWLLLTAFIFGLCTLRTLAIHIWLHVYHSFSLHDNHEFTAQCHSLRQRYQTVLEEENQAKHTHWKGQTGLDATEFRAI